MNDKMALIPIEQQQLVTRVSQQIAMTDRLLSLFNDDLPELIPYRKGDKWGFCDRNMKIVIEYVYDKVDKFSEGLAMVKKDGKYGFVDKKGNEKVPCIYFEAWKFLEDLARVKEDNKWGFINKNGNKTVPCIYDYAQKFSEGLAAVKKEDK